MHYHHDHPENDPNYKRFNKSDKAENYKDSDGYRKHLLSEGNSEENPIQPTQLI